MTNLRLILMYFPIINPVFDKYIWKEGKKDLRKLYRCCMVFNVFERDRI